MNSPPAFAPQWATVSSSPYPSLNSSQLLVLIGICFFKRLPGLVVEKTLLRRNILNFSNLLSIVADLILHNFSLTFSGITNSLNFVSTSTYSGSIGSNLCPQG